MLRNVRGVVIVDVRHSASTLSTAALDAATRTRVRELPAGMRQMERTFDGRG